MCVLFGFPDSEAQAVLTLLWRDVAGVTELTRMLAREGFLWCEPKQVSQQALSQRFLTFPAEIFESIFKGLLPEFTQKWYSRNQRPLPESIQFARTKFARIWAGDGSNLLDNCTHTLTCH